MKKFYLVLSFLSVLSVSSSASDVNVYFNQKHSVGGVDHFQRSKFITIHSANYEGLKSGGNDLMEYLINDLEVYYGRETGNLTNLSDNYPNNMSTASAQFKNSYSANSTAHAYENSQDLIVTGQYRVYGAFVSAAGHDHEAAGTTYGDFMSDYLSEACGTGGSTGLPRPKYLELLNEPLWDPIDQYVLWQGGGPNAQEETQILEEHFLFHREAAKEIHRQHPGTKVGGFAEAFPDPESRDWFNWDTRWKKFIDMCGADLDFYSFHLYDFHCHGGKKKYRKGGNMEAYMDLLSHYNYLTHGEEKPFLITEYGSRAHCEEDNAWNPYRDWLCASSINAMMLQFMDRPDMIEKTIPFIMAVWSQNWNIFRPDQNQAVYTDYIKFYELWKGVNGTRLVTNASDLDIQVDAYSTGTKTYVILNNLEDNEVTVNPNVLGVNTDKITSVASRHFYYDANNSQVMLDEEDLAGVPSSVTISGMGTMILVVTTSEALTIESTFEESRNYSTEYRKEISANTPISFSVNGLDLLSDGKATLRLGIERAHALSLKPVVKFNNTELTVPDDFRGDTQDQRDSFFGLLEMDVPYNLLEANNTVTVEFADVGGVVASVSLRLFNKKLGDVTSVNKVTENLVSVYPNPVTDRLFVDVEEGDVLSYSISTIEGSIVKTDALSNSINVSDLTSGVYLLRLDFKDEVKVLKFIKTE